MSAKDIELREFSTNDVPDDNASPTVSHGRYDYVRAASPANHVTNMTTGAAECNNRGEVKRETALRPITSSSNGDYKPSSSDYEEIPSPIGPITPPSKRHSQQPNAAHAFPSINTDAVRREPGYRHRDNPLYEPAASKSRDSKHVTSTGACPPCCLLVLVLMSIVLATAAVVLAIFAITMPLTERRSDTTATVVTDSSYYDIISSELNQSRQDVDAMIRLLRDDVTQLRAQIDNQSTHEALLLRLDQLETNLNISVDSLRVLKSTQDALLQRLDQTESDLNISQSRLSDVRNDLSSVNASLSDHVYNVSKMPGPPGPSGPQGPPGAGNLSACYHNVQSAGSVIYQTETYTGILDLRTTDHQNWVMTGATCTTEGGTQALLVVNEPERYSCVCRGNLSTTGSRYCILHYWMCPRTS